MSHPINRILVLGSGGSGKTTFSKKLATLTALPLFHLDSLYWKPGWTQPKQAEWTQTITTLAEQPRWIIDGSYGGTLALRVPKADLILYLDIPGWRCVWNILKRRVQYAKIFGKTRPGMAEGCPETIHFSFLWWVMTYPFHKRPGVLKTINELKQPSARLLLFRSYSEMDRYLRGLSSN